MQKLETILLLTFVTIVCLVIGGVLVAIYLWDRYSTIILLLAGSSFVVTLLAILAKTKFFEFVHHMYEAYTEDKRERRKTTLELRAQHQTQQNELALHWAKLRDETRLRMMELELQRITVIAEAQVRYLEVERWQAERAAGILAYQTTQALYKAATGEVINLSREPREPRYDSVPLSAEDLPHAPPFREVVGLMRAGLIPLAWTLDGPRLGTITDMLSMGLIGRPGRGKTTALMYFTCILLLLQAEVWVWDLHGELGMLSGFNYFDRFEDIVASVPSLQTELDERDELYRHTKRQSGVGQVKPPLVLIADEVPILADCERRSTKKGMPSPLGLLGDFVLEARKWNGYVFVSGQSLPHTVLPTLTRDNLSSRIILECSPNHARQMGLDKKTIDTLLPYLRGAEKGTHIADFSTWSEPELADIPYTDADDLRWVLERRQHQQDMSGYGKTDPFADTVGKEPEASHPASSNAVYHVIEEHPQPPLLQPAFHRTGQKRQGELLAVYHACTRLGTTDCRRVGEAAGMGKTKANELINALKRMGYLR